MLGLTRPKPNLEKGGFIPVDKDTSMVAKLKPGAGVQLELQEPSRQRFSSSVLSLNSIT
jgi:hypothetical protein